MKNSLHRLGCEVCGFVNFLCISFILALSAWWDVRGQGVCPRGGRLESLHDTSEAKESTNSARRKIVCNMLKNCYEVLHSSKRYTFNDHIIFVILSSIDGSVTITTFLIPWASHIISCTCMYNYNTMTWFLYSSMYAWRYRNLLAVQGIAHLALHFDDCYNHVSRGRPLSQGQRTQCMSSLLRPT